VQGYYVKNICRLLDETFSHEELVAHAYGLSFWVNEPEILQAEKDDLAAALVQYAAWRSQSYPYSLIDELLHWARMKSPTAVYEKYEPYYPAEGPQVGRALNLSLLCVRLNEAFSQYDLLALCVELHVLPMRFGLDKPYLKLEGLIALIDTFDKNGRIQELLFACHKIRPGIADDLSLAQES
jgi:hypothetical protein